MEKKKCMKEKFHFAINSKVSQSPTENIHIYFLQRSKNETFFFNNIQYTKLSQKIYNKM